ncbi:MAG: hypothetical protein ACI97K_002606 [Glaciecola sp.]|jgi:hypothetical protein
MARLSQKAWNNVIIFTMLAMVLILNISSFQSSDDDFPVPIIEEGAILLSLQIDQTLIERAGPTWRLSSSSLPMARENTEGVPSNKPANAVSQQEAVAGQLAGLVDNWQRALVKRQTQVEASALKNPDLVVVLWLAGERFGRVLPIKTIDNQTYLMFKDEIVLLDFPTLEQLTQW